MSETEPRNGVQWRIAQLEREMERLKEVKPEVVAERVTRLRDDLHDLRRHMDAQFEDLREERREGDKANSEELGTQRKILIGAWVSLATGLIVAYVLGGGGAAL